MNKPKMRKLFAVSVLALLLVSMFAGLGVWQIKPAQATTIFSDGFDAGNFDAWSGTSGTPTIVSAPTHHGPYAMSVDAGEYCIYNLTLRDTGHFRAYVNFTSLPTADSYTMGVCGFYQSALGSAYRAGAEIRVDPTDHIAKFTLGDGFAGSENITTVAPSVGVWYSVEVFYEKSGTSELWVDGVSKATLASTGYQIDTVYAGAPNNGQAKVETIDCCVVNDAYIGTGCAGFYVNKLGTTSTLANAASTFYASWINSTTNLSHHIFGTNNTGAWTNETATVFSTEWSNVSKTLNATAGVRVEYEIWANDSSNDWATTGLHYIITTEVTDRYYFDWNITDIDGNQITSTGSTTAYPSSYPTAYDNEIRAVFIHSASMTNANYTLICQTLAPYNITTIVLEIGGNNWLRYPSAYTASYDYHMFPEAIDAAHAYGMKVVAMMNVLAEGAYTGDGIERRVQNAAGTYGNDLCPTKQASRTLLKNLAEELVTNYDIDGFMFDYIRYGGNDYCYCSECKAKFIVDTGLTDVNWPYDVAIEGRKYYTAFRDWRCTPVNEVVRDMRGWMLAIRPDLEFSAAPWGVVVGYPMYWRTWLGQDWAYWVSQGWIDWVAPQMYSDSLSYVQSAINDIRTYWLGTQQGGIPIVPFIDDNVDTISTTANFSSRITLLRSMKVQGWCVYRYGGPGNNPSDSAAPDIRNYLGNITESSNTQLTISNINATAGSASATIRWMTNVAGTSKVEYNASQFFSWTKTGVLDSGYYAVHYDSGNIIDDATPSTSHTISIVGLQAGTIYYYRVLSQDLTVGLTALSKTYSFTTPTGTSWVLSNSTGPITYTEGQPTITAGNYNLTLSYHGVSLNTTALTTATNGNATTNLVINMKKHTSITNGYIATNITTAFTVNSETSSNLTVSMTGTGVALIVCDVPTNATSIKKNGVAIASWIYDASSTPYFITFNTSSLSTWEFMFADIVTSTVVNPTNTTYTTPTISVQLSASGGTIDTILWNCTFTNGTVAYANTVYTVATSMTLGNGTYIFNAYANNTLGEWDEATVMFTVAISTVSVTVTIVYPQNITYTSGTISIQISASGGTIDTIWYNCKNGTSWIYGSNLTYTIPTSMIGFESGTSYMFYGWANNTDGNSDEETVMFAVSIYTSPILFPIGGSYYFITGTRTTNNVTGYKLDSNSGSDSTTIIQTNVGNCTVSYAFMVSIIKHDGSLIDVTGITAVITRLDLGEGFQNGYASISYSSLALGYQAIRVRLYIRFDSGAWYASGDFVTEILIEKAIDTSTWNFTVYTKRLLTANGTWALFMFGDQSHNSRIGNVAFIDPLAQEIALWKLESGDIIGGMLYPFMLYTGNLIYGLGIMFVSGVLYLRHKKWEVILTFFLLYAGGAGIGYLIPDVAYRLVYIVIWFILTIVLYRVFR